MPNWKLDRTRIVPIVHEAAISHPDVGDGRFLPVLFVDCRHHGELNEAIHVHIGVDLGDVEVAWGKSPFSSKKVYLELRFERPVKTIATFEFDVNDKGKTVEWIRKVHGVYLRPASYGTVLSESIDAPGLLVEIPSTASFPWWENIYQKSLIKRFKRSGMGSYQATRAAAEFRARSEELWFVRAFPRANT